MSSLSTSESVLVKELFVSSKTPVQCHLTRAAKHLELDNSVLILNGLGKAINTTIDVALKLQEKFHNTIKLDIQTSTADIKVREHTDSLLKPWLTHASVPRGDENGRRTECCWSEELENMLAVFDFDQTIVDGNSDIVAIDLISPTNLVPNRKDFPNNWTQYMQRVFDIIKTIEIPAEQIIDVVSLMKPNDGMPKLMRALYENNVDIIVASDSNSLFIYNWLKHNKLSDIVSCIYTNPATISDSVIKIEPYAVQNKCNWCTTNMCKGAIMEEHALNSNKKYDKILYFGDGQNDLCPVLKLTKNDIAFPRVGYILENLLKSHITPAKVMPWCTGEYIYEFLKSSKLISA